MPTPKRYFRKRTLAKMRQKDLAARAERDGISIEEAERLAQIERHDVAMIRLRRLGWRP